MQVQRFLLCTNMRGIQSPKTIYCPSINSSHQASTRARDPPLPGTSSHTRLLRRSRPNAAVSIPFPVSVTLTTLAGFVIVDVASPDKVYVFVHVVDTFPIQQFTQTFSTTVAVFVTVVVAEALLVVFVTTTQQVSPGTRHVKDWGRVYF